MKELAFKIEEFISSFPDDREEMLSYINRAKKYSSECGCSLGAKFLMVSTAIFIVYFFLSNDFAMANLPEEIFLGTLFIFTSTIVGKLAGIGIARIRLALLYKHLTAKRLRQ